MTPMFGADVYMCRYACVRCGHACGCVCMYVSTHMCLCTHMRCQCVHASTLAHRCVRFFSRNHWGATKEKAGTGRVYSVPWLLQDWYPGGKDSLLPPQPYVGAEIQSPSRNPRLFSYLHRKEFQDPEEMVQG